MILPDEIAGITNGCFVASFCSWPKTLEASKNVGVKRRWKKIGVRLKGLIQANAFSLRTSLGLRPIHFIQGRQELRSQRIMLAVTHDRTLPSLPTL